MDERSEAEVKKPSPTPAPQAPPEPPLPEGGEKRAPDLRDIYLARRRIKEFARHTPLVVSKPLSEAAGEAVHLKLENAQETGSFKIRGAANKLLGLDDDVRQRGVVAVSSGNHGRAVAFVAAGLGIPATICLSSRVPASKVRAIEELGAAIVIGGEGQDEADDEARRVEEEKGLTFVHPFDDPQVIAGQGTIGLELLEDLPELSTVVVPLSGGGLISGIALAVKSASPDIRTIGVSMERGPAMYESLRAGKLVDVVEEDTLADALAGGLGAANRYTFQMCRRYVDKTVLVSEEEIAAAMASALSDHGLIVEGGGAVGIAAVLHGRVDIQGETVVVVSGGNVDVSLLLATVEKHGRGQDPEVRP